MTSPRTTDGSASGWITTRQPLPCRLSVAGGRTSADWTPSLSLAPNSTANGTTPSRRTIAQIEQLIPDEPLGPLTRAGVAGGLGRVGPEGPRGVAPADP